MSTLDPAARATIKNAGLTLAALVRFVGWGDGRWHGDSCGCSDDRCIGYHHDEGDGCGCLVALIEDALHVCCGVTRPDTLGYQRCVLTKGHEGRFHRSQDGGRYLVDVLGGPVRVGRGVLDHA